MLGAIISCFCLKNVRMSLCFSIPVISLVSSVGEQLGSRSFRIIMINLKCLRKRQQGDHREGQGVNYSSTQKTHSPQTCFQKRRWLSKMANSSRWGARLDISVINGRYFSWGRPSSRKNLIVNTRSDNSAARRFVTHPKISGKYYDTCAQYQYPIIK
jgi:hypothetical protein